MLSHADDLIDVVAIHFVKAFSESFLKCLGDIGLHSNSMLIFVEKVKETVFKLNFGRNFPETNAIHNRIPLAAPLGERPKGIIEAVIKMKPAQSLKCNKLFKRTNFINHCVKRPAFAWLSATTAPSRRAPFVSGQGLSSRVCSNSIME